MQQVRAPLRIGHRRHDHDPRGLNLETDVRNRRRVGAARQRHRDGSTGVDGIVRIRLRDFVLVARRPEECDEYQ